jgi:hypothetical protein
MRSPRELSPFLYFGADRAVELLRRTVTVDDLPQPYETPIEALAPEFEDLAQP